MFGEVCIKWGNHHSSIINVFKTLLQSNSLVDCTLAAEGQNIKAHKIVLSACSSFFQLMFNEDGGDHPIVIFTNISFQDLRNVVDYIYHGEVIIPDDQLDPFLDSAAYLQIKGFEDKEQNEAFKAARKTGFESDSIHATCTTKKGKRKLNLMPIKANKKKKNETNIVDSRVLNESSAELGITSNSHSGTNEKVLTPQALVPEVVYSDDDTERRNVVTQEEISLYNIRNVITSEATIDNALSGHAEATGFKEVYTDETTTQRSTKTQKRKSKKKQKKEMSYIDKEYCPLVTSASIETSGDYSRKNPDQISEEVSNSGKDRCSYSCLQDTEKPKLTLSGQEMKETDTTGCKKNSQSIINTSKISSYRESLIIPVYIPTIVASDVNDNISRVTSLSNKKVNKATPNTSTIPIDPPKFISKTVDLDDKLLSEATCSVAQSIHSCSECGQNFHSSYLLEIHKLKHKNEQSLEADQSEIEIKQGEHGLEVEQTKFLWGRHWM